MIHYSLIRIWCFFFQLDCVNDGLIMHLTIDRCELLTYWLTDWLTVSVNNWSDTFKSVKRILGKLYKCKKYHLPDWLTLINWRYWTWCWHDGLIYIMMAWYDVKGRGMEGYTEYSADMMDWSSSWWHGRGVWKIGLLR